MRYFQKLPFTYFSLGHPMMYDFRPLDIYQTNTSRLINRLFSILIFFFICHQPAFSSGTDKTACLNTETLLIQLDEMVKQRELYQKKIKTEIAGLRWKLKQAENDPQESFSILGDLFYKYRIFQVDTARMIAYERLRVAENLGEDCIREASVNIADALNRNDEQEQALKVLAAIKRSPSSLNDTYYYFTHKSIYFTLYNGEMDDARKLHFLKATEAYTDTLSRIGKPGTFSYIMDKCNGLVQNGESNKALYLLLDFYNHSTYSPLQKANIEFKLGEIYQQEMQDNEKTKLFFTLSAITDISNGNRVYVSLQQLAMLLFQQGDIERAYNYISCSLKDIVASRARYRLVDIAEYMNIIEAEKNLRDEEERRHLLFFVAILTIFVVVLAGTFFYIHKRNIKLQRIKKQLTEQNRRLQDMTDELTRINEEIKKTNHIKEEYIGFLFNICSDYIYKQEKIRKSLLKITSAGTMADVSQLLKSQPSSDEDFKAFINKFDTIFLSIFPNFVDSFNTLLREDERIELKKGELLIPELRIYALIRLGIDDNSKIANFLHYSLQTVYNYQMKMRNKAIVDGKNFTSQVQKL